MARILESLIKNTIAVHVDKGFVMTVQQNACQYQNEAGVKSLLGYAMNVRGSMKLSTKFSVDRKAWI